MLIGCSQQNKPGGNDNPFAAKGAQSSGGGATIKSSPDQVNAALDRALKLATEPDPRKNIFVQFWTDSGRNNQRSYIKNPASVFPDMAASIAAGKSYRPLPAPGFPTIGLQPEDLTALFKSPFLEALKHNKITRLESGDCLLVGTEHKDASVSKFDVDAELCFSIGNLQYLPPSSLLRETLALVLHESVHLSGNKDEEQAKAWQTEFSAYFGARFGDVTTDNVSARTLKKIGAAKILISRALEIANGDPKKPMIYNLVGKLSLELNSLPYFLDPLALELKTSPSHTELISNYSNAVLAAIEKIQTSFDVQFIHIQLFPKYRFTPQLAPEGVVPKLGELDKLMDRINENFLAFTGETEAQSVCVLPYSLPDLSGIDTNQMGAQDVGRIFLPLQECAPGTKK